MKVICPKCRRSIPVRKNDSHLKCGHCNFNFDRHRFGFSPGLTSLPLVRDLRGEKIGPYLIQELVSLGATGVLYRARTAGGEEDLALKVLHYDPLRKADFLSRFRPEMTALARLKHPNIAKVLDFGQGDDLFFYVSEFVEGVSLDHYLKSFNQLETDEIKSIMKQVCSAVAYAHEQGMTHGNIKPANIIMGQGTIKLVDFGVGHLATGGARLGLVGAPRTAIRLFNYLSPEQRLGSKEVDARSDVFSLGLILYEMLTGVMPVGVYKPPSALHKGLNRGLDRLTAKALNPNPKERHQSAGEMLEDLESSFKSGSSRSRTAFRAALLLLALAAIGLYLQPYWPLDWLKTVGRISAPAKANSVAEPSLPPGPPTEEASRNKQDKPASKNLPKPGKAGAAVSKANSPVMAERRGEDGALWVLVKNRDGKLNWVLAGENRQ